MTSTSEGNEKRRPPTRPQVDPDGNEVHKLVQARRLPPNPACVLCGETELEVLRQREVAKHLLEGHHVMGKANDGLVLATLCLNCHTKATDLQHEVGGIPPGKRRSGLEALDLALRSLGTFFELLAAACYRFAEIVARTVQALNEHVPAWRTLPGMP